MGLFQAILESADGGAFINVRDSGGTGITSTLVGGKQGLDVNVISSMTVGVADESAFTYGTTSFLPIGGVYSSSITNLTTGQSGAVSLTAYRDMRMNLRTSAGVELGNSSGNALFVQDTNAASILSLMQATTGTITTPALSTSSSIALASNAARKAMTFYNPTIFNVYLAFSATATTSAYTVLLRSNTGYERNSTRVYTGVVSMISATGASGTLIVTEET